MIDKFGCKLFVCLFLFVVIGLLFIVGVVLLIFVEGFKKFDVVSMFGIKNYLG